MSITVTNIQSPVEGLKLATLAFDSSYPTGGEQVTAAQFGFSRISRIDILPTGAAAGGAGYIFPVSVAASGLTANIFAFNSAGFTPAGTAAAQTFTPASTAGDLNLGTPAFSGTGLTAAGQVITTTSTHTMTLNQCAGMWLISETGATPPNLILSNTAVTGAAAVLTVQGAASTDAGAYKIVRVNTAGTNASSALSGTPVTAGVLVEAANATNLAALTAVPIVVYGY